MHEIIDIGDREWEEGHEDGGGEETIGGEEVGEEDDTCADYTFGEVEAGCWGCYFWRFVWD